MSITTCCRRCNFWEPDARRCAAGRLEKFQERGEAEEDGDSFRINRICNMFGLTDSSVEDRRALLKPTVSLLLFVNEWYTLDAVRTTLASIQPTETKIILRTDKITPAECALALQGKQAWSVVQIVDQSLGNWEVLDHVMLNVKSRYFSICLPGFVYPPHFLDGLDRILNDDLDQVVMIEGDNSLDGLTILTRLHKVLGGCHQLPIDVKVRRCQQDKTILKISDSRLCQR